MVPTFTHDLPMQQEKFSQVPSIHFPLLFLFYCFLDFVIRSQRKRKKKRKKDAMHPKWRVLGAQEMMDEDIKK